MARPTTGKRAAPKRKSKASMATSKPAAKTKSAAQPKPKPVDVHVGSRIRLRRNLLGLSQTKLGDATGLSFQQVQKYESSANRVSASRLFELSKALDVAVSYFFDDMPEETAGPKGRRREALKPFAADPLIERETLELVRAYYRIPNTLVRARLRELAKELVDMTDPD